MQACTRPSFLWTENIMHAVHDKATECGLVVGVSDPVWKQLGETGCCCGMLCVVDSIFLFFHLHFCGSANANDGNAA